GLNGTVGRGGNPKYRSHVDRASRPGASAGGFIRYAPGAVIAALLRLVRGSVVRAVGRAGRHPCILPLLPVTASGSALAGRQDAIVDVDWFCVEGLLFGPICQRLVLDPSSVRSRDFICKAIADVDTVTDDKLSTRDQEYGDNRANHAGERIHRIFVATGD